MKFHRSAQGFTLIELLVVISIIAILASMAIPASMGVVEKGKQAKDLNNARQIHQALFNFAGDHDGAFPYAVDEDGNAPGSTTVTNANDGFANLIPRYMTAEKIFYTAGSAWCNKKAPDENITGAAKLAGGENGYAYVTNLTTTSNGNYPLIADGFSSSVGTYSPNQNEKGGVWKGRTAIVVRVDGSAAPEKVNTSYKVMGNTGGSTPTDIFATGGGPADNPWLAAKNTIVNPKEPTNP